MNLTTLMSKTFVAWYIMRMSPVFQVSCAVQHPDVYTASTAQRPFASQSLEDAVDTRSLTPLHPSVLACTGMPETLHSFVSHIVQKSVTRQPI